MEYLAVEVPPSPSPSCSGVDCSAGTGREAAPPAERAPLRAGVEKAPREIATLDSLGAAWASSLRSARLLSRLTVRPMCPPCACSSSAMAASSTTLPCVEVWMPRAASCVRTRPTPFAAAAEVVEEEGGGGGGRRAFTATRELRSSPPLFGPPGSAAVGGGGVVVSSLARKMAESQLAPAPIARLRRARP